MKILIVEDKESLRRMLRKTLESRGFAVEEAADGVEAPDLVRRQDAVEQRLDSMQSIARKHRLEPADLPELRARLAAAGGDVHFDQLPLVDAAAAISEMIGAPVRVEDEDQVPVVSAELDSPGADAPDRGPRAGRFEPQVRLGPKELWRNDPAERQAEARVKESELQADVWHDAGAPLVLDSMALEIEAVRGTDSIRNSAVPSSPPTVCTTSNLSRFSAIAGIRYIAVVALRRSTST